MRVGIFDPYLDDLGGGEKYMMTIASHLSKKHTVDVFWDKKEDLDKISQRFDLNLSNVTLASNIFSKNSSTLNRLIKTRSYDALIVLSDGSIPLALSKKLFIHIQQPLSEMQLNKNKLKKITAFFVNSEFTKNYLHKRFLLNSKVIYPPVDLISKKLTKENIILSVGRLRFNKEHNSDYKKHSVLIEEFKKMVDKGLENWKFKLVVSVREEDIDELNKLQQNAKNYPIEFLINKPNKDLHDEYAKAKIYWHASGFGENLDEHPELAEHFGISTVEAMSAGCVPVVINAGGQKEIVTNKQNGLLWNSLEELKSYTNNLMQDNKLWEKLSKSARETSKKFSKEKFEKEIDSLIL